ncbi:glycosyltransferase family 2 protein [Candidatus Micrarchaeota archaeon]|nr:glycosyltransferase family 2 protein [Candidatus Micrarchaeota archaeon]
MTSLLFFLSNMLFLIAFTAFLIDLAIPTVFFAKKRKLRYEPIKDMKISVGMTAYNDEEPIGKAVRDFKKAADVVQVTVIDNNCTDNTALEARRKGARVVEEKVQGFGSACIRALKEARKHGNLVCLVEGDCTFSASDLKKLTSYIENVDMVVGTRTTAEIVSSDSQVNWFMRYGNLFIAKLIQLRYWDQCRLTDVGCAYRVVRPEALDKIINQLSVTGNHFLVDLILVSLKNDLKVIEIPITFRKRVGISKGVGSSFSKGMVTGLKMWRHILFT